MCPGESLTLALLLVSSLSEVLHFVKSLFFGAAELSYPRQPVDHPHLGVRHPACLRPLSLHAYEHVRFLVNLTLWAFWCSKLSPG